MLAPAIPMAIPGTDELARVVKELEFRSTVTSAMLSTLDLEQILYVILCGITSGDGLGFNRAFLFLDDEAGRSMRVTMAVGPSTGEEAGKIWEGIERKKLSLTDLLPRYELYRSDPSSQELARKMARFSLPLQDLEAIAASDHVLWVNKEAPLGGVMARCLVANSPFASNALTLIHEEGGAGQEVMAFRHVAIVPLTVAGKLIGAILADNRYTSRDVEPEDLRSLHALGLLAAVAIDRARLHAKTVAMAEVDGLTGVYNRRYYEQELSRFLEVTRRTGQTLSIILFDLDHFKRCNDDHGHLVGDQVLKDVARLLQENVRQSDRVARYGGEEFVVLLGDTTAETAAQVAKKLRQLVKEARIASGRVAGLTLSAGIASTTGEDTLEAFFERADRALYRAKFSGRDRVIVWRPGLTETVDRQGWVEGGHEDQ